MGKSKRRPHLNLRMAITVCSGRELVPQGRIGLAVVGGIQSYSKPEFIHDFGREDFGQEMGIGDILHLCIHDFPRLLNEPYLIWKFRLLLLLNLLGTKLGLLHGHQSYPRPHLELSSAGMQFDYALSAIKREKKAAWVET